MLLGRNFIHTLLVNTSLSGDYVNPRFSDGFQKIVAFAISRVSTHREPFA